MIAPEVGSSDCQPLRQHNGHGTAKGLLPRSIPVVANDHLVGVPCQETCLIRGQGGTHAGRLVQR